MSYVDSHRAELKKLNSKELITHLLKTPFIDAIKSYAAAHGVQAPNSMDAKERKIIENEVRAYVGQAVSENDGIYPILNTMDPVVDKALESLNAKPFYK